MSMGAESALNKYIRTLRGRIVELIAAKQQETEILEAKLSYARREIESQREMLSACES